MSLMNIIMHTAKGRSISAGIHHVKQLILQVLQMELHVKHQMQTTHNGMFIV